MNNISSLTVSEVIYKFKKMEKKIKKLINLNIRNIDIDCET